jgi:MFS family permease
MLPLSLLLFHALGPVSALYLAFAFLYGAGNGVITLVRGAIPAEIYGRSHYGAINGAMAAPVLIAKASGPLVAALVWTLSGGYASLALVLAAVAALTVVLLAFVQGARRARSSHA